METLVRDSSKTLATSSSVVLDTIPPNARRKAFIITNTSTGGETVTIGHGGDAVSGSGITIYPTGQYQQSRGADYTPYQGRITALGSAATATIAIHETLEVNV